MKNFYLKRKDRLEITMHRCKSSGLYLLRGNLYGRYISYRDLSILFGNNNETETAYVNTILLINFYPKLIGNNNFV